jgi:hypothetical protein
MSGWRRSWTVCSLEERGSTDELTEQVNKPRGSIHAGRLSAAVFRMKW